jgi:DNA-binding transcriptional LysR family regulator
VLDSIEALRLFIAVFEEGSIRAASERLGMTAAGGSKRLMALEDSVGRRLFNRTTRQLSPTSDGERLYHHARRIVESVSVAERGFLRETEITGRLRITASATFAQGYLSEVVSSYLSRYPDVIVDIHPTDQLVDLAAHGTDLAIRHGVMTDSTLIAQKISASRRLICAAPSYWEKHGMPKAPQDLLALDGMIVGKDATWMLSRGGLRKTCKIRSRFSSSLGEVVRQMAISGHGIALLMDWHVRDDVQSGRLVEALPEWTIEPPVGIYAVFPSRENLAPAVQSFVSHLKAWVAAHPI